MAVVRAFQQLSDENQRRFMKATGTAHRFAVLGTELSHQRADWNMCALQKLEGLKRDFGLEGVQRFPFADLNRPPAYFWKQRKKYHVDKLLGIHEQAIIANLGDGWLYWIFFRRAIQYIRTNQPIGAKGLKASVCFHEVVCKLLDHMLDLVLLVRRFPQKFVASGGLYHLGESSWFFQPLEESHYFRRPETDPVIKTMYTDVLARLQEQRWPLSAARHLAFRYLCRRSPAFCADMRQFSAEERFVKRRESCNIKAVCFDDLEAEVQSRKQPMPALSFVKGVYPYYSIPFQDPPECLSGSDEDELFADDPPAEANPARDRQ